MDRVFWINYFILDLDRVFWIVNFDNYLGSWRSVVARSQSLLHGA